MAFLQRPALALPPFPLLTFAAFCSSTKSLIMLCRSLLRLARSSTSSVCTVVRPAWRLKFSKSTATFSVTWISHGILRCGPGSRDRRRTDLCPHHLRQRPDELRGCVPVRLQTVLVDHLAHREPQRGFETLRRGGTGQRRVAWIFACPGLGTIPPTSPTSSSCASDMLCVWVGNLLKVACVARARARARVDQASSRPQ